MKAKIRAEFKERIILLERCNKDLTSRAVEADKKAREVSTEESRLTNEHDTSRTRLSSTQNNFMAAIQEWADLKDHLKHQGKELTKATRKIEREHSKKREAEVIIKQERTKRAQLEFYRSEKLAKERETKKGRDHELKKDEQTHRHNLCLLERQENQIAKAEAKSRREVEHRARMQEHMAILTRSVAPVQNGGMFPTNRALMQVS